MKTIKARHKLIPAIIMLIVAAITMSTASYAWFTMSNRVEVTGVELTVVAPTNILIREKKSSDYNNFLNTVSLSATSAGLTGKLNHASSVNGVDMFTVKDATTMVNTNGTLTSTATIISTTTPVATTEDGYYVDFFLELVNTGDKNVTVGLDNLTIDGVDDSAAGENIEGAVRFAILDGSTSKGVFGQGEGTTVAAYSAAGTPGTTADQTVLTTSANVFTLLAGGIAKNIASPTNMKSITVRVWIEGQDLDCVSAKAGSSFSIKFNFYVVD